MKAFFCALSESSSKNSLKRGALRVDKAEYQKKRSCPNKEPRKSSSKNSLKRGALRVDKAEYQKKRSCPNKEPRKKCVCRCFTRSPSGKVRELRPPRLKFTPRRLISPDLTSLD
ncbi:hypothetical protein QE152_g29171 [Popillia japonica]|uniref:Uncharacterized protein n=1 Tax=Popillia japonica TaxID=7064 RepID=A0AAW1JHY3_POPJA